MYAIISIIIIFLLLIVGLNIRITDIKKIKQISQDITLNKITNKLPKNLEVCKEILKILKNENVKIEENKETTTSLYMVMQNKIVIANIDNTFTRIQTIAHECIHSVQDKKILKFNFIFSNLYIPYFIITCILTIFKVTLYDINHHILMLVLILLSVVYTVIRSFLEINAMTRARYIAEKYIVSTEKLDDTEVQIILNQYDEINDIGIKLYHFSIITKCLLYIIIYSSILIMVSWDHRNMISFLPKNVVIFNNFGII